MLKYLFLLFVGFSFVFPSNAQSTSAEKIEMKTFKNLYKINDSVYRSEQPSKKGFALLEQEGLVTILNLRRNKDDECKARKTNLTLEHIRLKSKEINESDILNVLRTLKDAKKPILIHCWHGSDRTGVITAAYRIIFENWSKEAAIAEFRRPEFGYHEKWYPNLLDVLNDLDVERIRKELGVEI